MGSWGYQPKESDGALDALAPLDRALERELYALFGFDGAALERQDRRERRKSMKRTAKHKGRNPLRSRRYSGFTEAADRRGTRQHAREAGEKKSLRAQAWALQQRYWRVGALQVVLERGVSVPRAVIVWAISDLDTIIAEDNWQPTRRAARRLRMQLQAVLEHAWNLHAKRPSDSVARLAAGGAHDREQGAQAPREAKEGLIMAPPSVFPVAARWVVRCVDGVVVHERFKDGTFGGHYTKGGAGVAAQIWDARRPLCGPHVAGRVTEKEC